MGLLASAVFDVVGLKRLPQGLTITSITMGLSSFVSLPVAGQICCTDFILNSYCTPFNFVACSLVNLIFVLCHQFH